MLWLRGFLGNFVKILWEHINRSLLWRLKRPYTPLVRPGCNCISRGRKPSILLRSLRSNASWAHGCANMQWSATCCWPTSEPASARARNERAPRRLYHISMAKSSIFFTQNLEKLLDFPPTFITGSKLKITCKVRAKCVLRTHFLRAKCKVQSAQHALFVKLVLTHGGQFDKLLTWLGYTNHSEKAT